MLDLSPNEFREGRYQSLHPFSVTVGTPVYTHDGAKIGKVKEVRGEAFKVETGLFQRDYWLAADSVAEAVPDVPVTLAVDKNQIDTKKINEPQSA